MSAFAKYAFLFLLGGNAYCIIELIYRARTHYSMFFCAGMIVIILYYIFSLNKGINPYLFALIAAAVITIFEFIFGVIFNLWLGMNVWDYSAVPLNFIGQICLPFTAIWFVFGLVLYGVFSLVNTALQGFFR